MFVTKIFRRLVYTLVYHFYLKYKLSTTDTVKSYGFTLIVPPTVFHPKYYFSSGLLSNYLQSVDLNGKKVLDMGCGSGILSMVAASRGAFVASVDINPNAVNATKQNAQQNNLENSISAFEGNLFNPLPPEVKYDFILFNPPFYPSEPQTISDHAWKGGENYSVITEFINKSSHYLSLNGKILIILSSDMDIQRILEHFLVRKFVARCLDEKRTFFDTLYIYEAYINS